MMWRAFIAVLLNLLFANAYGSKISGYVTDAQSGETLPGATIKLKGTTTGVVTNLDGYYELNNLPEGNLTIIAEFMG